jgi:hypothetical protein
MMAAISGKDGLVHYDGGQVARISDWSLDINTDLHDVTAFSTGTVQWRSYIAGLSGWSGSFSGFFDEVSSTGQHDMQTKTLTPATGTIKLYTGYSLGDYFSGGILFSRQSVSASVGGEPVPVSWDFTGNSTLAWTTA